MFCVSFKYYLFLGVKIFEFRRLTISVWRQTTPVKVWIRNIIKNATSLLIVWHVDRRAAAGNPLLGSQIWKRVCQLMKSGVRLIGDSKPAVPQVVWYAVTTKCEFLGTTRVGRFQQPSTYLRQSSVCFASILNSSAIFGFQRHQSEFAGIQRILQSA